MHFIRLIRPLNLGIIALTFVGIRFYLHKYAPNFKESDVDFFLLIFSTLLIAAAGNIINDYFDLRADRINKPHKMIIAKHIKRRWAIVLHWLFNSCAFIIAVYLSLAYNSWMFIGVHLISIIFLWWYSVQLKRVPLIGNIVISLLALLVVVLCYHFIYLNNIAIFYSSIKIMGDHYIQLPVLYVIIAFMVMAFTQNFIREIVKDAEDVKGDKRINALTLPMLLGHTTTMILSGFLLLLLPIAYFVLVCSQELEWMVHPSLFIAVVLNFTAAIVAFSLRKKSVFWIKPFLKLSMLSGVLFLFF